MAWLRPRGLALACGTTLVTAAVLAGCSAPADSERPVTPSSSASSAPSAVPQEAAAAGDYAAFCEANSAAAAAKAGTVGEDLDAVAAQAAAIRALLPLRDVSAEVAAGAEVFAASAEETATVLAQFPADSLVSDVGLDPRFTESAAVQSALTDPDYQAFIVWTMQTCGIGSAGS